MKTELYFLISALLLISSVAAAENIDPQNTDNQYAYGENVGWINFEPSIVDTGASIGREYIKGYIWAENIGWINLSPDAYGGVYNDGYGNLSGYAWGENVGWINFSPDYGGVSIDTNGNFSGYAWGENIGWINFNSSDLSNQGVKVCVVNYLHLKTMAEQWLYVGTGLSADLKNDNNVDFLDFSTLASYWMDYCPDDWPL